MLFDKSIAFRTSRNDRLICYLLFICMAIIPLFENYNWISTILIYPTLALHLFLSDNLRNINFDKFIRNFLFIILFAFLSIISAYSLEFYIYEIKKLLGVLVILVITFFLLKRNINNIWLLYLILSAKFLIMFFFTYQSGILTNFDFTESRLQSGGMVGINANTYGYFAFISQFALAIIYNIRKNFILLILIVLVFFLSFYINTVTASRAGLFFTFMSTATIYLSLTFKKYNTFIFKIILLILSIISIIPLFNLFEDYSIFKRYIEFTSSYDDERLTIFLNGIDLILKNPLGVGAGHFENEMRLTDIGKYAASHNSFLLVTANYGWIALLYFIGMFVVIFKNIIKLLKENNLIIKKYALLFISFVSLFLFYNFFYDMLLNMYLMLMLFLVNFHVNILNNKMKYISKK